MSAHKQLDLLTLRPHVSQSIPIVVHDPYWDTEIIAPEHNNDRWNPKDFGEVPFKADDNQLTIFYDDSEEPPEPDDFNSIEEFEEAWSKWESVREQVRNITHKSAPEHIDSNSNEVNFATSQSSNTSVRGQIQQALETAPEHTHTSSNEVTQVTSYLLNTGVREQIKLQAPQHIQSGNQPKQAQKSNQWVEIYWVSRAGKKHYYYRYCWMEGRKISRTHIGSTTNPKALMRVDKVKDAIYQGNCSTYINQLIKEES